MQQIKVIILILTMSDEEAENILNMSLHRRRFSLFEKKHDDFQRTHRQEIKNRYKQFIQSKRKSLEEGPFSPETTAFAKTQETERSMPSIRVIREQNHLIGQSLRKTISRYNYINLEKEKKLQTLNRKKAKYEKVLKVREEHKSLKNKLTESLVSLNKELDEQKFRLKKSVDINKEMATQSRVQVYNAKKSLGQERRSEIFQNKHRIKENKSVELETNKKLHGQIMSEEKLLKIRKKIMAEDQKRSGVRLYCNKLKNTIKKFAQIQRVELDTKSKLSTRISELEKSKNLIDQKLKNYQKILKDGSTLKKAKMHIKIKGLPNSKRESLKGINFKDESQEDSYN